MISFRIAPYSVKPGIEIVEVWKGSDFLATICPTEKGVKVISKHFGDKPEERVGIDNSFPPAISIDLI